MPSSPPAEQASKPSLRGKAVVVGGLGPRGVVATASYEARVFGVHSAMPMAQARRLCPNAAYLMPRFALYRAGQRRRSWSCCGALSPLVEPLSLDEAFVDLEAGGTGPGRASGAAVGEQLRADITGRHRADRLRGPGRLQDAREDRLGAGQARRPGPDRARAPSGSCSPPCRCGPCPGVGPATGGARCAGPGSSRSARSAEAGEDELVRLLGKAHGASLYCDGARPGRPARWSPSGTPSPCRWRTPSTWTSHDRTRVQAEVAAARRPVCGAAARARAARGGRS